MNNEQNEQAAKIYNELVKRYGHKEAKRLWEELQDQVFLNDVKRLFLEWAEAKQCQLKQKQF